MSELMLKRKPLAEAIFEIRWRLQDVKRPVLDPDYKFVIGRLYDEVKDEYPFIQSMEISKLPEDVVFGLIQYRFRNDENEWPLVQIGPGVLTVNDTDNYKWSDFEKRVIKVVNSFFSVHPNSEQLKITATILRYVNVIKFDFDNDDIYKFLKEQMGITISLNPELLDDARVEGKPLEFTFNFCHRCSSPKGTINLKFSRGKSERSDAEVLLWDNFFYTRLNDVPAMPSELGDWLNQAHSVAEDWFFKLISKGQLLERFK